MPRKAPSVVPFFLLKTIPREWATHGDIWKRRTAIPAQLRAKQGTDAKRLADAIRPSIGHPEFFPRKGIGRALREYSKTDPGWVTAFRGAPVAARGANPSRERLL